MKASHNNAAGRVGYVRAVFSQRARGFAVPLDLLRVVCRVAGRVATRRRIGDAFRGYLVTESGRVVEMFSQSRWKYEPTGIYRYGLGPRQGELQLWAEDEGAADGCSLDAADWIAAGGCRSVDGKYSMGLSVVRGRE